MHGSIEFSDQHLTIVFEDRPWPSLYRLEPPADWSGFEALDIDLELRTSKPIDLWLYAGSDHTHSVNKKYPLTPGRQHIRLPFANFDRHNVEQLKIYTEQQFAGAKLTLHSIRLR